MNQRTDLGMGIGLVVSGAALVALAAVIRGSLWPAVLGLAIAGYGFRWLISYAVRYHSQTPVPTWVWLVVLLALLAVLPIAALSSTR